MATTRLKQSRSLSRSKSATHLASRFFEEITNPARSPKCMVSTTNAYANMGMQMYGNTLPTSSTTYLLPPSSTIKYSVSTVALVLVLIHWITSEAWTGFRRSRTRVRCVTCCGVIQTTDVGGALVQEVQGTHSVKIFQKLSITIMA